MKEFYHSKKKKIRGWKRHKRKVERWKQNVIDLDMDIIRENHREYAKLWIHPFYALGRINPPDWYKRLLLSAMIDVYINWYKKMEGENEDFYLKIWLYEPDFILSQIVVSYKDCIHYYDHTFDKSPLVKSFPYYKYDSLKDKLALFNWEAHIHAEHYWMEEFTKDVESGFRTEDEVREIMNKAYKTEAVGLNDVLYKVDTGNVWIGTIKGGDLLIK